MISNIDVECKGAFVALRNAVLGLLDQRPMTGFELLKEFDVSRSVIWPAPKNEVYRVLAALTAEGLIEETAFGARGARTYAVTAAGRAALADWLAAPSDYTLRYEPMLKAVFLRGADDGARRARAEADLAFFEAQLDRLKTAESNKTVEDRRGDGREMAIRFYSAMADWARGVRR